MKILYLCHRIPYPPNKGDKIRSFNEVRYLAARHELDLLCLADDPGDLKYRADLEKICRRVAVFPLYPTRAKARGLLSLVKGNSLSAGYFHQRDMQRCCDRWLQEGDYDAVLCFSSTMAEYLFHAASLAKGPRKVMDFCDVDSDKWLQYAAESRAPLSWLYRLENRRLADYERRIYREFGHSLLISEAEARLFRGICPEARNVAVIPNGVDYNYFSPGHDLPRVLPAEGPHLVFTGAMDYHVNVDGVLWFCREIWPLLKKDFPKLRFTIVGSKPTSAVLALAKLDGVAVTGFVDDVRPYYRDADVCVIPLRLGRGVQNKVLEALAMGKAAVATAKANAGIQADEGTHLRLADAPRDFAAAVAALLRERGQRERLGENARRFVTERYDWATNMEQLEKLLTR
ncbi:MAG: TIGR03087 family PEP-CTERM/XrtA system glycosyltransferase [Trichloromonas sp.]|nr:TIGR03087 family PEP-CTERM/XrtA system glycosyltransferase [Trichloromonas sp.]